jgi:hypothetical protein
MAGFEHVTGCNRLKRLDIGAESRHRGATAQRHEHRDYAFSSARIEGRRTRPRDDGTGETGVESVVERPPSYGTTSSTWGTFGVTIGPDGAHTMFTSLRIPNSPGR